MAVSLAFKSKESPWALLLRFFFQAGAVWLAASWLEGISYADTGSLLLAVVVLSLLSTFVRPLLILFALPFVVMTLGLGLWLINALLFWAVGSLLPGFEVKTFGAALIGAAFVSLGGAIASLLSLRWNLRTSTLRPEGASRMRQVPGGKDDVIDIDSRPG